MDLKLLVEAYESIYKDISDRRDELLKKICQHVRNYIATEEDIDDIPSASDEIEDRVHQICWILNQNTRYYEDDGYMYINIPKSLSRLRDYLKRIDTDDFKVRGNAIIGIIGDTDTMNLLHKSEDY